MSKSMVMLFFSVLEICASVAQKVHLELSCRRSLLSGFSCF